jgi:hypothetical protein
MFKVVLIQNISELRNYSYADLRGELRKLGLEVIDITRDNIDTLLPTIQQGADCVLFASNSLNDAKIYEYVCADAFAKAFGEYLDKGGSSLILHQNSLKDKPEPLPFLGGGIERLEGRYGGTNVSLKKADRSAEQYYVFPNRVSIDEVDADCFGNSAVAGNYWMLLKGSCEEWMPIMEDSFGNCVIGKMLHRKVIFSSILLDYQKHTRLLENILINLMVDNMSLALLESDEPDSLGFSYFLNSLENRKLYYKKYENSEAGLAELMGNIHLGIHSAILVTDKTMEGMNPEMIGSINRYGVKLIQVHDQDIGSSESFVVHSVDKSISLLFSKIELQIQKELAAGFVSGSFMKTVEVLMKLKEFESSGMTKGVYNKESIAHVFEKISPHLLEDGSYDRTFGATCKVLWLFGTFLGKTDKLTRSSYSYIKASACGNSMRESLEKHYVLADFEKDPRAYLEKTCAPIISEAIARDFAYVTEYDFLALCKVALRIGNEAMLIGLFRFIKAHVDERNEFFNSYVTAIISSHLIDMYDLISDKYQKERIRELLFDIVIYLRQVDTKNMSVEEVLQIVCALYKFESVVSFPVSDLTELIFKTGTFPHDYYAFENQINSYQKSRLEMDDIINTSKLVKQENKILRYYKKGFFATLLATVVLAYFLIYMLISTKEPILMTALTKIKETWPSLFSLLIIPLGTFIYNRFLKKRSDK